MPGAPPGPQTVLPRSRRPDDQRKPFAVVDVLDDGAHDLAGLLEELLLCVTWPGLLKVVGDLVVQSCKHGVDDG